MDTIELLERLAQSRGVAGRETAAAETACAELKQYAESVAVDPMGSVTAVIKQGSPLVLLDAHLDEIGLIVTWLGDNGFLKAGAVGGVDRRLLIAQEVVILAEEPVEGVIASKPPHLLSAEEEKKVPKVDDLWIDTGYTSEELRKRVSLGDRIILKSGFHKLLGGRVCSKALDDRAGVAAVLRALELLKNEPLSCGLAVTFTCQEELGCLGAKTASYTVEPDLAVTVDVSFAHTPDAPEHKCGKLGGGTMIGISPTLDKGVSDALTALAQEKEIPYQLEVMGGLTSTNADSITVSRGGVKCGLLSIPLRYMHTPIETIDPADVEATARLMAEFVKKAGGEDA